MNLPPSDPSQLSTSLGRFMFSVLIFYGCRSLFVLSSRKGKRQRGFQPPRDKESLRDEESDEDAPLFPVLSKRSTIQFLVPLATATLLAVTAINVLSSQGHDPTAPAASHKDLRTFLVSMPYSLLLVGLLGLTFAYVATSRRRHLLGFAAGFLLFELMYVVFVGGLVTIARSGVSGKIVWPATLVILIALVITWSLMCTYPEFLRFSGCCADRRVPLKKRCQVCKGETTDGKSLAPANEGENKCASCEGAVDMESQNPVDHTGMRGRGSASTKSDEGRDR